MPADQYGADVTSASVFLGASGADRVTLAAGFEDVGGSPQLMRQMVEAVVDSYALSLEVDEAGRQQLRGSIRGRDQAALLLERPYHKRFIRAPARATVLQAPAGTIPEKPLTGEQPDEIGVFRAQTVAAQVCRWIGKTLSWQAPDYELHEDFDANGRALDSLQRLAEPWQQVPPFRTDVYLLGETVVVRQRPVSPVAEWAFTVRDARISRLTLAKQQLKPYGRVVLEGKTVAFAGANRGRDGGRGQGVLVAGDVTVSTTSETRNAAQRVISRVEEATTYRMPDRILKKVVKRTYDATKLLTEEETTQDWESSIYDERGPINQPRLFRTDKVISGIAKGDRTKVLRPLKREELLYQYDSNRFLKVQTTTRSELNIRQGGLVEKEKLVRTLTDDKAGMVRETLETFKISKKDKQFYLASVDEKVNAGSRPGGYAARGPVGGAASQQQPLRLEQVISTAADAVDVTYRNPHLDLTALEQLMTLFEAASQRWEWEVSFTGVGMPWLARGTVLQLTDLVGPDDVPIALPPLTVTEVTRDVDEEAARYTQQVRAVGLV
jgi:hypothetical protein